MAQAGSARVIVVDDDRLIRELVRDALGERVRVEVCPDAESALAALSLAPADLVLSDLEMPGLSGLEFLVRVRREHPGTDFVLLTANASVDSAVEALRMGASDYLVKPVRKDELVVLVERLLARRRLLTENARLRDELRVVEACRALLRCLEPGEVYAVALDILVGALPTRRALAVFRRSAMAASFGVAFRGFEEGEARSLRERLVGTKPLDVDAFERIARVSEGALHEQLHELSIPAGPFLAIPVRGRETEMGVIFLMEGEAPFDPDALERARLIAGHAEVALHNAERYHHAKERAFIDDVTEVYNARFLLQATEREIQRAERYGKPLSVLFLDLDRFKLVNDRYGHLVGSDVLRQLSRTLLECIRQVDTLARYGGDEFTILLVDTGADEALTIAERIRRSVAEHVFEGAGGTPIQLTISVGVATYPRHAAGRDALLDVADKAMYRAKSRGRNCCCSADDLASA